MWKCSACLLPHSESSAVLMQYSGSVPLMCYLMFSTKRFAKLSNFFLLFALNLRLLQQSAFYHMKQLESLRTDELQSVMQVLVFAIAITFAGKIVMVGKHDRRMSLVYLLVM